MEPNLLERLTALWFWRPAAVGVSLGYALRVFEHAVWATGPTSGQTQRDMVRFAFIVLPQCVVIGVTIGYLITAVAAYMLRSSTVVGVSAYAAPALMSFLAADIRELLRRMWNG
jgi:hypothetical protein